MKRMISCLLTAVALLPLLLFTGCIQGVQTSELALVEAVGIDRTDDGRLKLTLQIFAPRGSGSATAVDSSKNNSAILTATGDTISQAVEQANQMQGKTMFLGHNRVIVLGQSLVAESIQPILSFFDRSENTRQNARVLVSAVTAEEIVSTGVQQGILSAESLEAMIRQGEESDGALECNYFSLSMQLDDTGGSALIPVIRPLPEEETQSQSQDSSSSGEEGVSMAQLSHFQLEGTALLQNYALTTVFSQEVTKGLCFLLNESDYPVLVLSYEDTTLSARLHQSSSSWSVSGEGAVLSVQAKASIDELLQAGRTGIGKRFYPDGAAGGGGDCLPLPVRLPGSDRLSSQCAGLDGSAKVERRGCLGSDEGKAGRVFGRAFPSGGSRGDLRPHRIGNESKSRQITWKNAACILPNGECRRRCFCNFEY